MDWLSRFRSDESGATLIEYSLIAALVFLAILLSAVALGGHTFELYTYIHDNVVPALGG